MADRFVQVFSDYNAGELSSFLIEITAQLLTVRDQHPELIAESEPPNTDSRWEVDRILDKVCLSLPIRTSVAPSSSHPRLA